MAYDMSHFLPGPNQASVDMDQARLPEPSTKFSSTYARLGLSYDIRLVGGSTASVGKEEIKPPSSLARTE